MSTSLQNLPFGAGPPSRIANGTPTAECIKPERHVGATEIKTTSLFPPAPASVRAVRHFIRMSLVAWDREREREIVVLLASELATNVIVHAGPHEEGSEFEVNLDWTADLVRVAVSDGHPEMPTVGSGAVDKPDGRGLILLDVLATSWGGRPKGSGKEVWFEVQG